MSERGNPSGFPSDPIPIPFENFEGLNTKSPRPAIKDTEMSICDGWIGYGPSYLRTLWGTGGVIYTAPAGLSVVWFNFGTIINDRPLCVALLSDGSLQAIDEGTLVVMQILTPGTILNPTSVLGFAQWSDQYLIFAAPQDNGYWIWSNGSPPPFSPTVLYTAGGVGPTVTLTNAGKNYIGNPTFTVQTTGAGTGTTFSILTSYQIQFDGPGPTFPPSPLAIVAVNNPGTGYAVDDFIVVTITGGGSDDSASAFVNIAAGAALSGVQVLNGGQQYSATSYATVTGGGGSGASVALQAQAGVITGITVVAPGDGFTSSPTINVIDPTSAGSGFSAAAEISGGQIGDPTIIGGGSGYTTAPVVTVIGDGTGAEVRALISGGSVTNLITVNRGFGYSKALLQFTGGNLGASITVNLMPFGVDGTGIEIAFSRVWVTRASRAGLFYALQPTSRVVFSAPGDPADFNPAHGAGAFRGNDAFLKIAYYALRQTNGFLYLIGDSSMNYISGVNTSSPSGSTAVTTTFQNTNADPQIGTSWPGSVQVFKRNIVFANTSGVFVSYGGAITKISDALDLLFDNNGAISGFNSNFTAAVADLYRVLRVYMILLPVVDSVTGQLANKLLIWDEKKWCTASQDRNLTFIASQELSSALTAWGTDGTNIFPLFQTPNQNITKTFQTKLWSNPGYYFTKQMLRLLGILQSSIPVTLDITVDNETASGSAQTITPSPASVVWTNGAITVTWVTNATVVAAWTGSNGFIVIGPLPMGNSGRMLGLSVQTTAADMAVLSLTMINQRFETNI